MRASALLTFLLVAAPLALAQSLPEGRVNWFGHEPIRVHLDFANLTAQDAGYADEARAALRWWEAGGNGRLAWNVSFVEVANASDADVVLWFRDAGRVGPLCEEDAQAIGCARPFERPVPVEILARRADGTFVPYRQVREVTEHEIGHALGFGHSSIPGDVMAPHASYAAQTAWRPGDWGRLLAGAAVMLAILGGLVFVGYRALRPNPDVGRVRLLTEAEMEGPCPVERRGHAFRDAEILVGGAWQAWRVCEHCNGGRPVEPSFSGGDNQGTG